MSSRQTNEKNMRHKTSEIKEALRVSVSFGEIEPRFRAEISSENEFEHRVFRTLEKRLNEQVLGAKLAIPTARSADGTRSSAPKPRSFRNWTERFASAVTCETTKRGPPTAGTTRGRGAVAHRASDDGGQIPML